MAHLLWQISSGLNGLGGKNHSLPDNLQEAKSYGITDFLLLRIILSSRYSWSFS